ncbi:MAG: OmpA-like protein [Ignavibacteria bacterium]|nr:OmpA-like protein [Ignavibacteria bacterium]
MQKIFNKLASIFFLMGFFLILSLNSSGKQSGNSQNEVQNTSQSGFYMYAALIEDTKKPAEDEDNQSIIFDKRRIRIINLGPIVNTKKLDYAPTVSADGRTLFFVSDRTGSKLENQIGAPSHDFWAVKKKDRLDSIFEPPYNIDTTTNLGNLGVNTFKNEGAASIAADRQTLYFTGCNRPDGLGSCDIYMTTIEGDQWQRPVNLGKNVNSKYFESQPSIAPDKSRLYFVSTRPGPNSDGEMDKNNFDIWYCEWDMDNEEWKEAKNLGSINTKGSDCSPFIAADNSTLFFASDGIKPNVGGLDFYFVRREADADNKETWSSPSLLPEPINTADDEQFITLPASGDIIYFSSRRTDLRGYQGDLDIFMAFVPSFFRTVLVKGTVVDECSQEFIPSQITIKNPITGAVFTDSLSLGKKEFQLIVANKDYGDPRDSLKAVTLEVTAFNPKYGKRTKAQQVIKPKMTKNREDIEVHADEVFVTITLGQRPTIEPDIAEADYINLNKGIKPELATFNGLVMEETIKWDLYPLLNYVFFDLGESKIPDRYILFNSPDETKAFADSIIPGGTLDKYYHMMNIYGFRLNKHPEVKIEIVGCNDGTSAPEKRAGLSKERAQNVYNYFLNVWKISEDRIKLTYRDIPQTKSNLKDSFGIVENRRVEILCSEWEVVKPVFDKIPTILPQPEKMRFKLKNGIEDMLVTSRRIEVRRNGQVWNDFSNTGLTDEFYNWDWKSNKGVYPTDEVPFTAQLFVMTSSGKECASDPVTIPIMQVRHESQTIKKDAGSGSSGGNQERTDSTLENYSLILFPFDKFDAGPLNEKIMRDYVYERCFPTSAIEVIGHTDVVGLYDHNKTLSDKRATTVEQGINKQTKGKYGKLSKRGVGEDEALYTNDLPEGRFYNRTVGVKLRTPVKDIPPDKQ